MRAGFYSRDGAPGFMKLRLHDANPQSSQVRQQPWRRFSGTATVTLPRSDVTHWIESDQVGIEGPSGQLFVLVEKDFQCLHRSNREDGDAFPNRLVKSSLD